jgi:hypothetical protein
VTWNCRESVWAFAVTARHGRASLVGQPLGLEGLGPIFSRACPFLRSFPRLLFLTNAGHQQLQAAPTLWSALRPVSIGKSSHHLSPPLHHDDHITITSESKTVKSKNFQAQQADCLYTLCIVYSLEILHADMSSSRLPCTRPMRSRSIKRAVQIVYIANRILPMSFTYPSE